MNIHPLSALALAGAVLATPAAALNSNGERCVQIRSVDFNAGVIEVYNFGATDVDMTGWRFCSHDFNEARRYSSSTGLDGVMLESGTSIYVHFNDDAPGGDVDRLDRSSLGSFALPLDQDAYGMQLFFPDAAGNINFGNSTLIADHLQWNVDGTSPGSSTTRSGQAVSEGLWNDINDFISTQSDSVALGLTDLSGDISGEPDEYDVFDLLLSQTALIPGGMTTFTAENAFAGENIFFLYSLSGTGAGPSVPALGGLQLDLLNPVVVLGSGMASPTGVAQFTAPIPASAPPIMVFTQVVAPRGLGAVDSVKSQTVTAQIQ